MRERYDMDILLRAEALPAARLMGVETGGCPHTAIREDASTNLAATFSPELWDLTSYEIDVAGGEKIPRTGGPGITRSDLLVINKTDLAPHVGTKLEVMRGARPFVFSNLRSGAGVDDIVAFIRHQGLLDAALAFT